jgi:hypothetical protein
MENGRERREEDIVTNGVESSWRNVQEVDEIRDH